MRNDTLYERLDGREGIRAVVDEFYDEVLDDEMLRPLFRDSDMPKLRRMLTDFLCEKAGGPETYDGGPIRERHFHVRLTPEHIQRALELLRESLDEHDIPEEDADAVVESIARYQSDLLATPDDRDRQRL